MPVRYVDRSDLRPGDVVMFRGTDFIDRLIIELDGGDYSHSASYLGEGEILEAIAEGVKRRSLNESIGDHRPEYADVFRFRSDTNIILDGELPYDPPIKARAYYYEHEGDSYAYDDLVLLGVLTTIRHTPAIGPISRHLLDAAAEILSRIVAEGKHPLICSALVFRCFEEAGLPYHIHVPDAELLAVEGATEMQAGAAQISFLRHFILAIGDLSREVTHVHQTSTLGMAALEPAPDFVTPRDLQYSPNLNKLGRI
jgi:hypothetical protein